MRCIIPPWSGKGWGQICQKITAKIGSIAELDTRITSRFPGKLRPRSISQLLETYFSAEGHLVSRESFMEEIIPMLQDLVRRAPAIFKGVPLTILSPGITHNFVYTREQCACITACMWFGLFAKITISDGEKLELPPASFHTIFTSQNILPLQFLMCYFNRLHLSLGALDFKSARVVIKRNPPVTYDWAASTAPLSAVSYADSPMDASEAQIITVSSNQIIGGEATFSGTLTQECLVLLTRPDSLITLLLVSKLESDTVTVMGCERVSSYHGYGCGMVFDGDWDDQTPAGSDGKITLRQSALIFMDASKRPSPKAQMTSDFQRDLDKALCGYSSVKLKTAVIAAGNWAHGYIGADMSIKFIQQLLAASAAGHPIIYHSREDFRELVEVFMSRAEGRTISELYTKYWEAAEENKRYSNVIMFDCINFDY